MLWELNPLPSCKRGAEWRGWPQRHPGNHAVPCWAPRTPTWPKTHSLWLVGACRKKATCSEGEAGNCWVQDPISNTKRKAGNPPSNENHQRLKGEMGCKREKVRTNTHATPQTQVHRVR